MKQHKIVAILIPFDPVRQTMMLVRSTVEHPDPRYRHKLKAIGGIVEPDESPTQGVWRELDEEFPDWFDQASYLRQALERFGHLGYINPLGTSCNPIKTDDTGFGYIGEIPGGETDDTIWTWCVWVTEMDLTWGTYIGARQSATESSPEIFSLWEPINDAAPGFSPVINAVRSAIRSAYNLDGFKCYIDWETWRVEELGEFYIEPHWDEIEFFNLNENKAIVNIWHGNIYREIPFNLLRTQPNNDPEFQVNPAFNPGIKIPNEYIQK